VNCGSLTRIWLRSDLLFAEILIEDAELGGGPALAKRRSCQVAEHRVIARQFAWFRAPRAFFTMIDATFRWTSTCCNCQRQRRRRLSLRMGEGGEAMAAAATKARISGDRRRFMRGSFRSTRRQSPGEECSMTITLPASRRSAVYVGSSLYRPRSFAPKPASSEESAIPEPLEHRQFARRTEKKGAAGKCVS